jgi:hypothetical protein
MRTTALFVLLAAAGTARAERSVTTESFFELLRKRQVRTLEDAAAALPPELRVGRHLVYESRSQDRALVSFEEPRLVATTADGTLAVAMANRGKVVDGRYVEQIELVEHDAGTDHEVPALIELEPSRARLTLFRAGDGKLATCFGCHGARDGRGLVVAASFRRLWDTYPVWKGFYGSAHPAGESLGGEFLPSVENRVALQAMRSVYPAEEVEGLRKFLAGPSSRTGIYKTLDLPRPGTEDELAHVLRRFAGENFETTVRFSYLNARRIVRRLEARPGFSARLPELVAAAIGLQGPALEALSPGIASSSAPWEKLAERTARDLYGYYGPGPAGREDALPLGPDNTVPPAIFAIAEALGERPEDWSMTHGFDDERHPSRRIAHNTGLVGTGHLGDELVAAAARVVPEFDGLRGEPMRLYRADIPEAYTRSLGAFPMGDYFAGLVATYRHRIGCAGTVAH